MLVSKSRSFLYQEPRSSCQVPPQAAVEQLLSPACGTQTDTDEHMPGVSGQLDRAVVSQGVLESYLGVAVLGM